MMRLLDQSEQHLANDLLDSYPGDLNDLLPCTNLVFVTDNGVTFLVQFQDPNIIQILFAKGKGLTTEHKSDLIKFFNELSNHDDVEIRFTGLTPAHDRLYRRLYS